MPGPFSTKGKNEWLGQLVAHQARTVMFVLGEGAEKSYSKARPPLPRLAIDGRASPLAYQVAKMTWSLPSHVAVAEPDPTRVTVTS